MSKYWYRKGLVCTCGTPVSDKSASGLCRSCFMAKNHADPERARKIGESHRKRLLDPVNYAEHCERNRRAAATRCLTPESREQMAQHMRDVIQPLSMTPENLAKRDYALTGRLSAAAKLAWCPEEYRDEYLRLNNSKRIPKEEAKKIIMAQVRADRKRNAPKPEPMSPFERQERALANGAQLVANDRLPNQSMPGHSPFEVRAA